MKGPGTYTVINNMLGCAGGTLRGSGNAMLAASRTGSALTGRLAFDNGWTPPYSGTLQDGSHISGAFQSIDRGPCPFDLYFGLVP